MNKRLVKNLPRESFAILLAVLIALLALAVFGKLYSCSDDSINWQTVPLPDLTDQPIRLDVGYVENPRFATLDQAQLQAILQRTEQLVQQHFSVQVQLNYTHTLPIDEFFKILPTTVMQHRAQSIIHPGDIDQDDRLYLRKSLYQSLQASQSDLQSLIDYASPYLMDASNLDSLADVARAAVDSMLVRIQYWYGHKAGDGRPVLDASPYNQWVWWDSMGYGELPYDVVMTNQLVASLENYDQQIHSSLRGGISGGTMTYSRQGKFQGYVFVSVYPMVNNNPLLAQLKNDLHAYTDEQLTDYAAATLAHELGHLLFHYGHPFGEPSCIMAPTPLLKYREWYDGLDAQACRAAQHPQMQPGAARIIYNPHW